jgi:carbamate kinase
MTTTTTHPTDDNDRSILQRKRMILTVGGNPLQCRGERLTIENMMKAAADIAPTVAELCQRHEIVLTHGNGPQVGGLALE